MLFSFRVDRETTPPAKAIQLGKASEISSALERREAMFIFMMQSPLSYAQSFQERYGVRLDDEA